MITDEVMNAAFYEVKLATKAYRDFMNDNSTVVEDQEDEIYSIESLNVKAVKLQFVLTIGLKEEMERLNKIVMEKQNKLSALNIEWRKQNKLD